MINVSSFDRAHFFSLRGDALFGGLYLLELLNRLVAERQKEPVIFATAVSTLASMEAGHELQACLRSFELDLLEQLGYGVVFDRDARTGAPIDPSKRYEFVSLQGFVAASGVAPAEHHGAGLLGEWLLKAHARDFSQLQTRRLTKHVVRQALQPLLGDKLLVSRKMLAPR